MTTPTAHETIDRSARRLAMLDAFERVVKLAAILLTLVIAAVLLGGGALVVIPRLNDAKDFQHRQVVIQRQAKCFAQYNAEMLGAAFDALSAPPAPNPAREQAVAKGLSVAKKLQHPQEACP